jgi:hypothetical protein
MKTDRAAERREARDFWKDYSRKAGLRRKGFTLSEAVRMLRKAA